MEWVTTVLQWFADFFQWITVDFLLGGLFDALASIIESIPVPDFYSSVASSASSLAAGPIGWAWGMMQFGTGLTMVSTAYVARFVLRRIPFIGG